VARKTKPAPAETWPGPGEILASATVSWLDAGRHQLLSAIRDERLPHGLLIHGPADIGQSGLAVWAAQLALCDVPSRAPCGECAGCRLFLAGNHPDFRTVKIEDKASVIKVDQVRELCTALSLKSYRGGRKVGIIDPADKMNAFSFNALLKTLEEPPEDTLLVLVAARIDRMPRTVVSRCQRIRIQVPAAGEAIEWLEGRASRDDWPVLLALAGGAPARALALAEAGMAELAEETRALFGRRHIDPVGLADAWSRDRPAERLAVLEYQLEQCLRAGLGVRSDVVNNNRDLSLPSDRSGVNITSAFGLLDRTRDARALLDTSLNTQLLLEDLLVGLAEALVGRDAGRMETQG